MNKQLKEIEIPFGAKDSEFCGWEYTIPKGMEATIVNNKIVVKKKESDDERIRKEIINYFECQIKDEPTRKNIINKWINWLKKHDEQKPQGKSALEAITEEKVDNRNYVKPTNKIKPKFKVGDWVVNIITKEIEQVIEVTDYEYICSGHLIISFNNQHLLKKWTIKDAKDGDILACGNDIVIFKENNYNPKDKSGCMFVYCSCNNFYEIGGINPTTYKPATKEQRETLFKTIHEEGYEWDSKKKVLKKIEQKSTWNEEDEKGLSDALWAVEQARSIAKDENDMGNLWYAERWLKLIKQRING